MNAIRSTTPVPVIFFARSSRLIVFASPRGMPVREVWSPSTSAFTAAHHLSFHEANFHTAGKDLIMPVLNVTVTGSNGPAPAPALYSDSPVGKAPQKKPRKRRRFGGLSGLFNSKKSGSTSRPDSINLIDQRHLGCEQNSSGEDEGQGPSDAKLNSKSSPTLYQSDGISVVRP